MLVGYVSDERYVAIADALVEFERDDQSVAVVRSTPRGGIFADIEPGEYRVTLVKDGFGSKSVMMTVGPVQPYQFRLLSDGLFGYVWPKWVRTGERSEFRVHAVEPYHLSLWRYGWEKELVTSLGWFDEHGPRAVMQITPDGDYTQTGVGWNKVGYGSPHLTQFVTGPAHFGLYYLHAKTESGRFFSLPWVVAPDRPSAPIAVVASTNTWNAYNNFGGRSNYVNSAGLPPAPTVNARQDQTRYTQAGADNVRIGVAVPARPPTSPYAPKVALYVIFGVAVGALAAVAIVALASYLGASRRSGTSLTSIGGGMILGAIPFDRRLRREQNRLFFLRGISPKADEAIRFIRSRITPFAGPKNALRLAITSPGQGDGKSTLAANLATAIARTNTPTVLIDANLRAPSLHKIFGLSNETGLTDLLANPATSWISAAQAVCQDLVLITAGPISGDAMELVDARHVRRLLDSIDLPGGIILIDTPAALERGDALEVASGCDGVVIVGPTTSLRRGLLSQAVNLFHDAGVRVFGIVIHAQRSNDIDMTWRQDSGESLRPLALRGPKLVGRTRRRRDSDTAISAFEPSGASFPQ